MARINMTSSEPVKVMRVFEEMFGLDLSSLKKMLIGTQLNGAMTVTKKLADPAETVIVQLTIEPDSSPK